MLCPSIRGSSLSGPPGKEPRKLLRLGTPSSPKFPRRLVWTRPGGGRIAQRSTAKPERTWHCRAGSRARMEKGGGRRAREPSFSSERRMPGLVWLNRRGSLYLRHPSVCFVRRRRNFFGTAPGGHSRPAAGDLPGPQGEGASVADGASAAVGGAAAAAFDADRNCCCRTSAGTLP